MGRAKPIVVGARVFASKKDATVACQSLLKQKTLTPADQAFLADLLELHHERDQKVGCGVAEFYVGADGFGGRCFWLRRLDGSTTDWSFKTCITPPSPESEALAAFRRAILVQVRQHHESAFAESRFVNCAITGKPVQREFAHVDHRPPNTFLRLVNRFLEAEGLQLGSVAVLPTTDG